MRLFRFLRPKRFSDASLREFAAQKNTQLDAHYGSRRIVLDIQMNRPDLYTTLPLYGLSALVLSSFLSVSRLALRSAFRRGNGSPFFFRFDNFRLKNILSPTRTLTTQNVCR